MDNNIKVKCRYELSADMLKQLVCDTFNVIPGFVTITTVQQSIGQGMDEHVQNVVKCYIECDKPLSDLILSCTNPKLSTK